MPDNNQIKQFKSLYKTHKLIDGIKIDAIRSKLSSQARELRLQESYLIINELMAVIEILELERRGKLKVGKAILINLLQSKKKMAVDFLQK
jgi:hypothetical protein